MDYYNDSDPHAAAWLRNLCSEGLIPEGIVDERSIQEITPADLVNIRRFHAFAGIGGWAHALALAGWPAIRPVWTASLPCQPFSTAGKRKGRADERHLWPVFFRLLRECRPATCFGEQVASDDGYRWLARVRDEMEEAGYAVGCADLPACCQGAPHIRQRLFWVAHAGRAGLRPVGQQMGGKTRGDQGQEDQRQRVRPDAGNGGATGGLGDTNGTREGTLGGVPAGPGTERAGGAGFWDAFDLVPCRDGKNRRVEPGSFPLVDGTAFKLADGSTREGVSRAAVLRGIGNAIVPQAAAAFIRAFLETEG